MIRNKYDTTLQSDFECMYSSYMKEPLELLVEYNVETLDKYEKFYLENNNITQYRNGWTKFPFLNKLKDR